MAKVWPYKVSTTVHKTRFRELLAWLNGQNHILHDTVKFGQNYYNNGDDHVVQEVLFKDKNAAMMFKLAWGGK